MLSASWSPPLFCGIEHAGKGVDDEVVNVVEEDVGVVELGESFALDEWQPASAVASNTMSIDTFIRRLMTCSLPLGAGRR